MRDTGSWSAHKTPQAKLLKAIPGIGDIHALEILSTVVDIRRFPSPGHFLSYCGLIKHEMISGGRSYGKRNTHYSRTLKTTFKMMAFVALKEGSKNEYVDRYNFLITKKSYPLHQARHAIARRMACHVFGILKSNTKYKQKEFITDKQNKT